MSKYELFILPGKRDGSLAGSPEYVAGDVIAGMYWWTANFMGIGDFRPSLPPVCRSLAGAPKKVTGNFRCMIDPDEFKRGPGFMNGAPLAVGGDLTVEFPPDDPPEEDGQSRLVGSFLWDSGGKIVPAFTDGMARRYDGVIKFSILHPVARGLGRRRKKDDLYIDAAPAGKDLSGIMFPGTDLTGILVPVCGDPDLCKNWLRGVNGVGGVIR